MFKPRQMVRLASEARGTEVPRKDRRAQARSLDQQGIDSLFAEATGILPQSFLQESEEAESQDPTLDAYDSLTAAAMNAFEAAGESSGSPDSDLLIRAITGAIRSFREDDGLLTESVRQRNEERSWAVRTANVAFRATRYRTGVQRTPQPGAGPVCAHPRHRDALRA